MTTMKERLARAIQRHHHENGKLRPSYQEATAQANAVLREMLIGTTLEVRMAGAKAITLEHMKARANYDAFCDAWQAAIQAAIDE